MPTKFVSRRAALPRRATGVTPSNCAMGFAVISIARSFTFRVQPSSASVVVPRHEARAQGVPSMITKRIWKSGPRRIKRVEWGFTAQRNGKQVRRVREEWTKEDAERAFSEWTIEGSDVSHRHGCGAGRHDLRGDGREVPREEKERGQALDSGRRGAQRAAAGVLRKGDAAGSHPHAPRGGVPDGATGDDVTPGPAAGAGHGQPRGRAPALDSADGARLGRAGAGCRCSR